MRIEDIRLEKTGDGARVTATVHWEDCGRTTQDICFETVGEFADSLSSSPHAFLVACIMPALYFGEERLSIEGEVCPELKCGLMTIQNWMRYWWYKPTQELVKIEARTGPGVPLFHNSGRAGLFFSGGVDALATLRANRLDYPLEYPGSLRDGLLVCGLEIRDPIIFRYVMDSVSVLAKEADITLIPIVTNIRSLGPEDNNEFWGKFWLHEFMGATFAAIAHAFSGRLTDVSISSCHDIPNLIPYSSHPLINPNYSSRTLRIRHEGITMSRFEKTKLVAGWDLALQHLRVCNKTELYRPGFFNCGKCEKCVRTMLALLALGVLGKTDVFHSHDVSEELVMTTVNLASNTLPLYEELISPLTGIGRNDLVRAVRRKISDCHQSEKHRKLRRTLIEPILEYDQKHFHGGLRTLKRVIFRGGAIWDK